MGRVFVVQIPRRRDKRTGEWVQFDISVASVYGTLESPLFGEKGAEFVTAPGVSILRSRLKDFSDDDTIMAIGDPAAIAAACAVAADMNRGRFSVLRWDGRTRQYVKLDFNIRP